MSAMKLSKRLFIHVLLTLTLLFVHCVQGVLLDVFIIGEEPRQVSRYFWLVPDFLLIIGFSIVMMTGYKYCQRSHFSRREKGRQHDGDVDDIDASVLASKSCTFPRCLFIYFRTMGAAVTHCQSVHLWLIYSSCLVAKLAYIFKTEIPNRPTADSEILTPQLLKFTLALTTAIFYLLVAGQHDDTDDDEQSTVNTTIQNLCTGTSFDILDSITFMSMLIQSESKLIFSWHLENSIIAFACAPFLLPTIALLKLSRSQYGLHSVCLVSNFVYNMLHLLLVNVPYFVIRSYLWTAYGSDISPFIIKNLLHIVTALHRLYCDFQKMYANMDAVVLPPSNSPNQICGVVTGEQVNMMSSTFESNTDSKHEKSQETVV